jgi:hypothetical protein
MHWIKWESGTIWELRYKNYRGFIKQDNYSSNFYAQISINSKVIVSPLNPHFTLDSAKHWAEKLISQS